MAEVNYLKQHNTYVDSIYYCPHVPEENCNCRKPKPGLLIKATNDFDIDLEKSYFIGDSESDLKAAKEARCKGILLKNDQTLLQIVQNQLS